MGSSKMYDEQPRNHHSVRPKKSFVPLSAFGSLRPTLAHHIVNTITLAGKTDTTICGTFEEH
jgi:hypothetical protein